MSEIKVNSVVNSTGDNDSGLDLSTNDKVAIKIADAEVATVDTTGVVFNDASADRDFRVESNGNANMLFVDGGDDAVVIGHNASRTTLFNTTATASLQIEGTSGNTASMSIVRNSNDDNGPQLVLGKSNGTANGAVTAVTADALLGRISFQGADGTQTVEAGRIECLVDTTPGADDMPGRLVFSTTADGASSPTERMRIDNSGNLLVGVTSATSAEQFSMNVDSNINFGIGIKGTNTANNAVYLRFFNSSGATAGSIQQNGSTSTNFETSSDYRLKENVDYSFDATTELKKLKPCKFNFKADKDRIVEGFLAHEVQDIVPQAITGKKDEVDADGNPVYQGIDQSKLVPLLTKTLQEALTRIETLEAEVKALKG